MKLLTSLIFLFPFLSLAQESTIYGKIVDKNKKPVKNVNLFLEGSYDGGSTDSLGNYRFTTSETGAKQLHATAAGYISQTINIMIKDSTAANLVLLKDNTTIDEVVVQAGQFRVGNLSKSVMSPLDIVTTAGSMGNIVAALEKLPGAQIAGENGRLMIRGGTAHETQTYINGIRVSQPYTNTTNGVPVRGRFSPNLFKGTNFSTGGYSAEYGNALSSILNLTTSYDIEPNKTEITLSNVALGLGNTHAWKNTSLGFNLGYTNLQPYSKIIQQRIKWTKPYEQFSGEAILKNKGKNHFFNVYGSYAIEKMGFSDFDIDYDTTVNASIKSNNIYVNTNYIQYLSQNWKWESGASYGYATKNTLYYKYIIPNTEHHGHIKSKINKIVNARFQFSAGAEYFFDQLNEQFSSPESNTFHYGYQQQIGAAFAIANFRLWNKFYFETGLRYNNDFKTNQFVEPRLNITYQINQKHQAAVAYGTFNQNAAEEVLKYNDRLNWSRATHYILNYNYSSTGKQLRLELFHKKYSRLVTYNTISPAYNSQYNTLGNGMSQGLDLFWKDDRTVRNFQYWISYSLTDVSKLENNYPNTVQPSYVAKHYASIVGKYWVAAWRSQIGLTNTFGPGRPYHNPNQQTFMTGKTKPINNLAFNWSYLLSQQKILHFSVTNLLGQEPVYGYKYAQTANDLGRFGEQPILPTAKRFVFVGFFWTISKNKKENNLHNL